MTRIGIPAFGLLSVAFSLFVIAFIAGPRMRYGIDYVNIVYLVTAICWLVCGIGLLKKKDWARKGLIFMSAIYLFDSFQQPSYIWKAISASMWSVLLLLGISTTFFVALLIFLFLPRVKRLIAGQDS
jgi:hypothetical protein